MLNPIASKHAPPSQTSRLLRRGSVLGVMGALALSLMAPSASAEPTAEPEAGLKPGTAVPRFNLPVVNKWEEQRKWGPHKWMGTKAKEKKKLVVMSFFATYCDPCKEEMPELVRLYDKYKDEGLGIMLVSIDKNKDEEGNLNRDKVVALANANKVSFPVLHDRFNIVARKYEAVRLPYMLMVGPDGKVRKAHVGYTDELKASLENEIRAELGLKALAMADDAKDQAKPKEKAKKKAKKKYKKKYKKKTSSKSKS